MLNPADPWLESDVLSTLEPYMSHPGFKFRFFFKIQHVTLVKTTHMCRYTWGLKLTDQTGVFSVYSGAGQWANKHRDCKTACGLPGNAKLRVKAGPNP
jgi:hypothetical protein